MTKDNGKDNGGWERVTSEFAPWFVKTPNVTLTGNLLGRFSFKSDGKERFFYQFELTCDGIKATKRSEENKEEMEEVILNTGDIISVDESFALERDLAPLSDDGGKYEIRLAYGEPERKKDGTPKFWPVKIDKRTLKQPTRRSNVRTNQNNDNREYNEEDDMPF